MSKKHYEFIAWLIGQYVIPMSLHEEFGMDAPSRAMGVKLFITHLAAFLLEDNPRFDPGRFSEAILASMREALGDEFMEAMDKGIAMLERDSGNDDGIMTNDL